MAFNIITSSCDDNTLHRIVNEINPGAPSNEQLNKIVEMLPLAEAAYEDQV